MKSKMLYVIQIFLGLGLAIYFNPFTFNLNAGILSIIICGLLAYIGVYGLQKKMPFSKLPSWMKFATVGAFVTLVGFIVLGAWLALVF